MFGDQRHAGARVAVVGGERADPLDAPLLLPALRAAGLGVDAVSWRDTAVRWAGYDLVLLRSCWDYVTDVDGFLGWVRTVAAATTVLNPAPLVEWNADKGYLVALAARGVPVVPSVRLPPGAPFRWPESVDRGADLVVKPAVGAGSRLIGRYPYRCIDEAAAHARRLHRDGHAVLLQPYMPSVDDRGETAVYVIDGRATHAMTKSPVLVTGAAPAEGFELAVAQRVVAVDPPPALASFAERIVRELPGGVPLYARVDTVEGPSGPLLLELELIEPALFLDRAPHVVEDVVAAIAARVSQRASRGQ